MASRAAPWCDRCGIPARFYGDMSWTSLCGDCGEWLLVDNMRGMKDPQSVAYKRWKMAHQISRMGRRRKYTPSRAESNALTELLAKKLIHLEC